MVLVRRHSMTVLFWGEIQFKLGIFGFLPIEPLKPACPQRQTTLFVASSPVNYWFRLRFHRSRCSIARCFYSLPYTPSAYRVLTDDTADYSHFYQILKLLKMVLERLEARANKNALARVAIKPRVRLI